jgi:hypothetical protein
MKRLILALALLLAACSSARAATATPNYGITVPDVAETGWGPPLQTWANDFIDNALLLNGVLAPNAATSAFKEGWAITLDADNDTPTPQSFIIRGPTGNVVTRTTEGGPLGLGVGVNLEFEGSVDDSFQTTVTVVNPTADRTITLPNATGTVALENKLVESFPTGCPDGEGILASGGSMICSTVGGGGGGAPTNASYFVAAADGSLTNEIVLPPTDDSTIVANGTTWQTKIVPSCNGANQALTYNAATNAYGCVTISSGGAPTNASYLVAAADGTLSNEIVVSPTDDGVQVGNGATWQVKVVPSCSGANQALTYNNSTNSYGCNTISGSGSSSGVAGRVQFSDGAGGFLSDNALQWDNSNKRLGINTTSPVSALHLASGRATFVHGGANPNTWPSQVGPFDFPHRFVASFPNNPSVNFNTAISAKAETNGFQPTVASMGLGIANASGSQVWGGNFIGTVNANGGIALGTEINVAMVQLAGFSETRNYLQMQSVAAALARNGIVFNGPVVQSTGSLILTQAGATANIGVNFLASTFTSKVAMNTGPNSIEVRELVGLTRPGAAAARIFLQSIGGGRSQLCALFDTGASQCFATEP